MCNLKGQEWEKKEPDVFVSSSGGVENGCCDVERPFILENQQRKGCVDKRKKKTAERGITPASTFPPQGEFDLRLGQILFGEHSGERARRGVVDKLKKGRSWAVV